MARRPCLEPRCPVLVERGRCPAHDTSQAWQVTHGATRLRGEGLQRRRAELFAREPLCRVCKAAGRTKVATIRDHVVPLAEGGSDTEDNVQPLCRTCSDAKTREEAARGRQRAGRAMGRTQ